jgi:hypothetical protein
MVKRFLSIGLFSLACLGIVRTEARAQYEYLGSGWDFCAEFGICSYHHSMRFKVPGTSNIFFLSDAVWYDNLVVCKNKGGNITFNPGIGQITTEGTAQVSLRDPCLNRGKGGECTETVVYATSVAELQNDPILLMSCQAAVGDTTLTAQQCFLRFYGLENFHCRNTNDTPIEVRTKGVCAVATAQTCSGSSCTTEAQQGVRFTFPSFDQFPGDSFTAQDDASCVACVKGTGLCQPAG